MKIRRPARILVSTSEIGPTVSQLSRRGFIVTAASVGAAAALAACGSTSTGSKSSASPGGDSLDGKSIESQLVLANYADYIDPENLTGFTSDQGPKVVLEVYSSGEEMIAKVNGGGAKWDVVVAGPTEVNQLKELKLLRKLDRSLLPNRSNLLPALTESVWDPGNQYSVPKALGVVGFYWRDGLIRGADEAKSTADMFEVIRQNKGSKIWFFNTAKESFTIALSAVGKPIGSEKDEDIELAKEALISLKPSITNYGSDQLSAGQAGKIDLALGYTGTAFVINRSLKKNPMKFLLPSVGSTEYIVDNWAVPVSGANPVAAHAFINYMLEPEVAAKEVNTTFFQVPVKGMDSYLDPEIAASPFINVTDQQLAAYEVLVATPTYLDKVSKAFAEFKAA